MMRPASSPSKQTTSFVRTVHRTIQMETHSRAYQSDQVQDGSRDTESRGVQTFTNLSCRDSLAMQNRRGPVLSQPYAPGDVDREA